MPDPPRPPKPKLSLVMSRFLTFGENRLKPWRTSGPHTAGEDNSSNSATPSTPLPYASVLKNSQSATRPRSAMAALKEEDFPSLSNGSLPQSQSALWGGSGVSRSSTGPVGRSQTTNTVTSHLAQPQQSEDPYNQSNSGRLQASVQGVFRYSPNGAVNINQQQMASSSIDEFPPLSREGSQSSSVPFHTVGGPSGGAIGSQNNQNNTPIQPPQQGQSTPTRQLGQTTHAAVQNRSGNSLLNVLNGASLAQRPASSVSNGAPGLPAPVARRPAQQVNLEEETDMAPGSSFQPRTTAGVNGQTPKTPSTEESEEVPTNAAGAPVTDLLMGMPEIDKWGMRGLVTLMDLSPDYHAMVSGIDVNNLGIDVMSSEMISPQNYSLFDDVLPRPPTPKIPLPDCYHVANTQPIDQVVRSFNEESLFYMFYSLPNDVRQYMAAAELHARNWRWHKRLQMWITKDETMVTHTISLSEERGFYIVWDTATWRKEQREIILAYSDLEANAPVVPSPVEA